MNKTAKTIQITDLDLGHVAFLNFYDGMQESHLLFADRMTSLEIKFTLLDGLNLIPERLRLLEERNIPTLVIDTSGVTANQAKPIIDEYLAMSINKYCPQRVILTGGTLTGFLPMLFDLHHPSTEFFVLNHNDLSLTKISHE